MNDETRLFRALNSNRIEELDVTFKYFYQKYKPLLIFVAAQYIKNKTDIEDIVQDTFIEFFNNVDKIHSSVKSYLITSCKNKALDFLKKQKNITYFDIENIVYLQDLNNVGEASFYVNDNLIQIIEDMGKTLSNEEINIVFLHLIYDFKFEEIALKLKQNIMTIKSKYYRALKKYKKSKEQKTR
ncbi:MAG: sigma-70 family RNA polymerase sigma factor [Erysipelotrichales bacterium]|nr:sigma-70 family RNA polymerase sigma factor [Erysipelotrichales bacterium]